MSKGVMAFLLLGFVIFSFAPSVYELSKSTTLHPERQFELVHNFPTDYNFYLSRIRQGLEGKWVVTERYTTEIHKGSFVHQMYLLMGQVGRFVRVPGGRIGDIYHVARFVLAIVLLYAMVRFAHDVWKGKAFWATLSFLLVVTASSWPKVTYIDGLLRFGGYMPWWSVVDSLQRIAFIPHILLGQILMLALVGLMAHMTRVQIGTVVLLGLGGGLLGMVFPPGLLFVYTVLGVCGLLRWWWDKKFPKSYVVSLGGFVLVSAPSLVYLALVTSFYPWKRLAEFDILHPLPFAYGEYAQALGPMLPLGLLGLLIAIRNKSRSMLPAIGWVVGWMALLFLFRFVPQQSPLRFTEMLPNIGLGVLTGYLFYTIFTAKMPKPMASVVRFGALVVSFGLVLLGVFHMYSSYLWQRDFVDHKIRATIPLVPTGSFVMYPLRDFMAAISYIADNTQKDDVILSQTTAGNYIPAYSGNRVYVGHDNTVEAERKKEEVRMFYAGLMSENQARSWVDTHQFSMIFFGPQEKEEAGGRELGNIYPFVQVAYQNAYVTIYRVR